MPRWEQAWRAAAKLSGTGRLTISKMAVGHATSSARRHEDVVKSPIMEMPSIRWRSAMYSYAPAPRIVEEIALA